MLREVHSSALLTSTSVALLLFVILFMRFLIWLRFSETPAFGKGQKFLQIVLLSVAVSVLAFPLGLPLAVDFAIATATTRMLKQNNLVRVRNIMETMGSITTLCIDETGGLTQNKMVVVAITLGASFPDPETSISDFAAKIPSHIKPILLHSIAVNSTALETEKNGAKTFIGNETEIALLWFSRNHLGMGPVAEERSNVHVVHVSPFDKDKKYMISTIKLPDGNYRMFMKGAPEVLLQWCSQIVVDDDAKQEREVRMTPEKEEAVNSTITAFAGRSLRTIGFAYRDLATWPPENGG